MNFTYLWLTMIIPVIWLLIASIQDIKRREVENWISFSLLAVGIAINVFYSIFNKIYINLVYMTIITIAVYILSLTLYYGRIFGGGDAKILIALAPFLIYTPYFFTDKITYFNLPFIAVFFLNVVLIGSVYGLVFSIILAVKNKKGFLKEMKRGTKNKEIKIISTISFALSLISLILFFKLWVYLLLSVFIILLALPFLFLFLKSVEKSSMISYIDSKKLTEGDWFAEKIKINGKWIKPSEGLNLADIKLLNKYRKKVLIKQGIPFVPVFFLAFLTSLFYNLVIEFVLLFAAV